MIRLAKSQNNSIRASLPNEHIDSSNDRHWKVETLQLSIRAGMLFRTIYDSLKERGMDALLLVIPFAVLALFL